MSDFQSPPDPAGSALEKLVLQHRYSVPNEVARYLESEGIEPDTAQKVALALEQWDGDKNNIYQELLNELELWANIHTHGGAGGTGAVPTIKNKDTIPEFNKTGAGTAKVDLPANVSLGDTIWYLVVEEYPETIVNSDGTTSPEQYTFPTLLTRGPVFQNYLNNDHTIAIWRLIVDESNINEGGVYFKGLEGGAKTFLHMLGGIGANIQHGVSVSDGSLVHPLDPFTALNTDSIILLFGGMILAGDSRIWNIDEGALVHQNSFGYWAIFEKLPDGTDYAPTITWTDTTSDRNIGYAYIEMYPVTA